MRKFIVLIFILMSFLFGGIALVAHEDNISDAAQQQRDQVWSTFSATNHCRMIKSETFLNGNSIWHCDVGNFDVVRRPN